LPIKERPQRQQNAQPGEELPSSNTPWLSPAQGAGERRRGTLQQRIKVQRAPVKPNSQRRQIQGEIYDGHASPRLMPYIVLSSVSAISEGVAATPMPAALNASI